MPRMPISEQALRLALTRPTASRQYQYVCRACVRQYHPSPVFRAELPFWKRITNSLFGTKEEKAATEKRDEAHQQRLQELAEEGGGKTETFVDDQGREWTIAAIVDPTINKEYVQAQRWDGLEWVGSKEWIARKSDTGEAYVGFNPRRTLALDDEDQWRRLLHHVTVEVLALAQAGRDISAVFNERPVRNKDWLRTARVQVKVTNGAAELQLPTDESLESILKAIPKSLAEEIIMAAENAEASQNSSKKKGKKAKKTVAEEIEDEPTQECIDPKDTDAAEKATMRAIRSAIKLSSGTIYGNKSNIGVARKLGEPLPTTVDTGFLKASLADPTIKLSILKRVQQLTGKRVRDYLISSATTVSDLFDALKIKPVPARLFETEQLKEVNQILPNVTVHGGRQTPIHKHREVGRWKVIEEELINRGLPVTGSRYQGAKTTSPR